MKKLFSFTCVILLLALIFHFQAPLTSSVMEEYQAIRGFQAQVAQIPADSPAPETAGTLSKNMQWSYLGKNYRWQVAVPNNLLDWDREVYQEVESFYSGNGHSRPLILPIIPASIKQLIIANSSNDNGNFVPYVNEINNTQWTGALAQNLAQRAAADGYDWFHQAEFIQSFVCSIPYQPTRIAELPAQTLVDNGDCKDKTILLASLLKSLGYKVALLGFLPDNGQEGHMALGIVFNNEQVPQQRNLYYYLHDGLKYYYAETTEPGWRIGQASMKQPASIYDIK